MGIIGNLTSAEILEQLVYANSVTRIRNVVFMGMGEPLYVESTVEIVQLSLTLNTSVVDNRNNYDNVKLAIEAMIDCNRFGLCKFPVADE
jgi:adenine C2-methylase RlmN of 23S rRNA A2503 and tRNA A37